MNPTRRGLLEGAARAFADNGVRRSTMQSIAAAAGVAKATLYNHFRTKDDVARALLALELDRLTDLAGSRPPGEALAALSDALGGHLVLRRLAEVEPETLAGLLAVDGDRWVGLRDRLAGALRTDADGADLAARWLLGVVVQPGRSIDRHRQAARLAAVLDAGAPVGRDGRGERV
ncbi:MAG: helix-turn-helix transcriptional regulator [Blastococcus sp.]|nr:helix-turn-helix transcriptional regulator [Blastococcus sp.]